MSLWLGTLLFLTFTTCMSTPSKPSSIQDIIRNKLSTLKSLRDRQINRRGDSEALSIKGRDYGMNSHSNNYDTALTALAFLSFGVYLLNLLLMAMNRTNGRRRRDTEYEYQPGDVTTFSDLMGFIGDSLSYYFYDSTPECGFKSLCIAKESLKKHSTIRSVISSADGREVVNLLPGSDYTGTFEKILQDGNCSRYKTKNCLLVDKLEDVFWKLTEPQNQLSQHSPRKNARIRRQGNFFNSLGFLGQTFNIIRHLFHLN